MGGGNDWRPRPDADVFALCARQRAINLHSALGDVLPTRTSILAPAVAVALATKRDKSQPDPPKQKSATHPGVRREARGEITSAVRRESRLTAEEIISELAFQASSS
ncbi:hypothetical protein PR003_g470 [Phytophthora rubi]|uniref:Uncharacterized protein n=1 Tax=Phytophthora rubi TaxID=129364 RepID=A0A6A4G498_9STRA|nr:hypothetical protein PR003_g470 [Phytophthora rubi]